MVHLPEALPPSPTASPALPFSHLILTPLFPGSSTTANLLKSIYGWVSTKRGNYASGFHVYAFEWTGEWMRFYTDNRLQVRVVPLCVVFAL